MTTTYDFGQLRFRLRNYCAHPERWVSFMKVPGEDNKGIWRCVFPAKTEETDKEVMSDAWIQARFAECLPAGGPYEIIHRNMYNVHQRVAGNFRQGRIILAGDAAHINNPIGGMGMNSGFQDGLNVAEKLAEIRNGADPEPLLDRYDRQRRSPRSSMCRRNRSLTSACSRRAIRQSERPISTISGRSRPTRTHILTSFGAAP